jgi:hypothetical protein
MKFSMIYEAQIADPTPEEERRTLLEMVEQAEALDRFGFDVSGASSTPRSPIMRI